MTYCGKRRKTDDRVRVLRFSRNFGFQRSILTNYLHARGEAVVQIDADLQDPPELISEFLDRWEKGFLVVYGVRRRRDEPFLMELSRKLYYRFVDRISDYSVPPDAGDFRLIDRRIIEHLRNVKDQNPYLRGVIAALGYPQTGVIYDRTARVAGESKFGVMKLIRLGLDGITSQSTQPLRIITFFGFALCGVTTVMAFVYLMLWAFGVNAAPEGFTTLVLLLLFSIGINAAMLGVMGEYVGRIFDNVRGHPFTIIEKSIDASGEKVHLEVAEGREGSAMKVVILAGGFGTRLSEETDLRPKPLVEIGERPVLWHIMKIYAAAGLKDFVICCGYKGAMIKKYFADYYLQTSDMTVDLASNSIEFLQSKTEDWRVTLVDTGLDTMTGGRLKRVSKYVGDETFCMTYGDGVTDLDVANVIQFHKKHGKLASVTAVPSPGRFGILDISNEMWSNGSMRKPDNEMGWINGGFFVLEPGVLKYIDGDETIWERQPLESLARDGELGAYRHDGFWKPMDTLRDKRELDEMWAEGRAPWKRWD